MDLASTIPGINIEGRLGRGSMATVYLARHIASGQALAIKVMRKGKRDPRFRERFERESRAMEGLESRHVCRGFGHGLLPDGTPYLMMEHLQGVDLGRRVAVEPPLSDREVLAILRQAALGLSDAHAAGIIHRDVKPDNIFLCDADATSHGKQVVKLVDFGVTAMEEEVGGAARLTHSGEVLGTPNYMAPEQAAGALGVDGRADIYGLAAVGYHLLAGTPPHGEGTAMAVVSRKLSVDPDDLAMYRPDLPGVVCRTIMAGLQRAPDDRPPDMTTYGRMLAAARHVLGGAPPTSPHLVSLTAPSGASALVLGVLISGEGPLLVAQDQLRQAGGRPLPVGAGRYVAILGADVSLKAGLRLAQSLLAEVRSVAVVTLDDAPERALLRALPKILGAVTLEAGKVVLDERTSARVRQFAERQRAD